MLTTVVGATVGLTGFVVTVSVLVVQMATGTFSARYMRLWYRDGILKAVLAVLIGTFIFSFSLLRRVETRTRCRTSASALCGVFLGSGLVLFLVFLDRFVHRLRPVAVAALVAKAGRQSLRNVARDASSPKRQADDDEIRCARRAARRVVRAQRPAGRDPGGRRARARRVGAEHDCVLVLPHAVGRLRLRAGRRSFRCTAR